MRKRKCANCVNGQGIVGIRIYCSKHHKETKDDSVCPDHNFIEEEFDLGSPTPFMDWLKKQWLTTLPTSSASVHYAYADQLKKLLEFSVCESSYNQVRSKVFYPGLGL